MRNSWWNRSESFSSSANSAFVPTAVAALAASATSLDALQQLAYLSVEHAQALLGALIEEVNQEGELVLALFGIMKDDSKPVFQRVREPYG